MPIKYTRDGEGLNRSMRESRWPQPRLRQRMLIIYAGLSIMAIALIGYFVGADPNQENPRKEARAVVAEKRIDDSGHEPSYELVLVVAMPEGDPVRTLLHTDAESWAAVSEGDEVTVRYEIPFLSTQIRVYGMSMGTEQLEKE